MCALRSGVEGEESIALSCQAEESLLRATRCTLYPNLPQMWEAGRAAAECCAQSEHPNAIQDFLRETMGEDALGIPASWARIPAALLGCKGKFSCLQARCISWA